MTHSSLGLLSRGGCEGLQSQTELGLVCRKDCNTVITAELPPLPRDWGLHNAIVGKSPGNLEGSICRTLKNFREVGWAWNLMENSAKSGLL